MAPFFSFASPIEVDIKLENEEDRQQVSVKLEGNKTETNPIYYDGESVKGQVSSLVLMTAYAVA